MDINIHEESHVEEILKELMQRFGAQEDNTQLKQFLVETLEQKAEKQEILFYESNFQLNQQNNVSAEYGLGKIKGHEIWQESHQPKLHVYYKSI